MSSAAYSYGFVLGHEKIAWPAFLRSVPKIEPLVGELEQAASHLTGPSVRVLSHPYRTGPIATEKSTGVLSQMHDWAKRHRDAAALGLGLSVPAATATPQAVTEMMGVRPITSPTRAEDLPQMLHTMSLSRTAQRMKQEANVVTEPLSTPDWLRRYKERNETPGLWMLDPPSRPYVFNPTHTDLEQRRQSLEDYVTAFGHLPEL